nr:hypothetical protein [Tanacetum cinerariifolium]
GERQDDFKENVETPLSFAEEGIANSRVGKPSGKTAFPEPKARER